LAADGLVRTGGAAGLIAAMLLASCAPKKPAPPAPPPGVPAPPVARPAALDPESYMAFAASSALFAVRASDMAEARASTDKIKKFAMRVVMEQTGIGAQLSFAGRRIDLLPSSRPIPQHQAMLEELATSADFDATYKAQLAMVLTEAAAAHRAFEADGDSPTLRPVARFAAPVCEKNLEQLRKL
jgi:predicted outer membrane protein